MLFQTTRIQECMSSVFLGFLMRPLQKEGIVGYLRTGYPKKAQRPPKDDPLTDQPTC
jgi:hypothetical protein